MEDPDTATTRERPLIDAAQQVRHLKERGVRFELTDERETERFLRESKFFFEVKAFAKCFSRYTSPDSEHFGSYIGLDFAYLAELTRLDHHLRESVLSLTLDIERYMKVELDRMIMDAGDDSYGLMASFFESEYERKIKVPCRTPSSIDPHTLKSRRSKAMVPSAKSTAPETPSTVAPAKAPIPPDATPSGSNRASGVTSPSQESSSPTPESICARTKRIHKETPAHRATETFGNAQAPAQHAPERNSQRQKVAALTATRSEASSSPGNKAWAQASSHAVSTATRRTRQKTRTLACESMSLVRPMGYASR